MSRPSTSRLTHVDDDPALDLRRRAPFEGRSAEIRALDAERLGRDERADPRGAPPSVDRPMTPREARRAERQARRDARRLNQANRGLRMILVFGLLAVAVSWAGAVAQDYVRMMTAERLVASDQDALRVMCATNPPGPREYGWLRICEAAAAIGPSTDLGGDIEARLAE